MRAYLPRKHNASIMLSFGRRLVCEDPKEVKQQNIKKGRLSRVKIESRQ